MIESIINNVVVIRADLRSDGQLAGQVLDEGSIVCLQDRRVLGPIFETFGAISSPLYSVRLPSDHPLLATDVGSIAAKDGLTAGVPVYFPTNPGLASILHTQQIKMSQLKGSDASNLYDEEPAENEVEFSDDEQEQEYRRMLKQRRKLRAHDYALSESMMGDGESVSDEDDEGSVAQAPQEAGLEEEDGPLPMQVESADAAEWSPAAQSASTAAEVSTLPARPFRASDARRGIARDAGGSRGQHQRGRGAGRGRGNDASRQGGAPFSGRGRARSAPRGRGSPRDAREPSRGYAPRPGGSHALPPRPTFQHPDALPYDDPPAVDRGFTYHDPVPNSHVAVPAPQPMRPQTRDEGYNPMMPTSPYHNLPARQSWPSNFASGNVAYPSNPYANYPHPSNGQYPYAYPAAQTPTSSSGTSFNNTPRESFMYPYRQTQF